MPKQIVPTYSQEEKRAFRLQTCARCIFAKCDGNESNKCNIDTLKCTLDDSLIRVKANNLNNTCAKHFWDATNQTQIIDVPKSCGCGG